MKYIQEDIAIKHSVLTKLPAGCTFGPLVKIEDMDRKERTAVILFWSERNPMPNGTGYFPRKAFFCVETGDYLSEY